MKRILLIILLGTTAFAAQSQVLKINKYLVDSLNGAGFYKLYHDTTHTGQWGLVGSGSGGGSGGSGTVNSGAQYRLAYYATAGTAVSNASAITANRALISDANGVPTQSTTTATQLNYLSNASGTTGTPSTNLVFSTSPTLVTPILGTPQSVTLTNGTGLPLSTGVTGTLQATNFPALTGDVTTSAGSLTTAIVSGVIVNDDINASAAIDATKLIDGSVSNTELGYINTLSSNAQTQLDAKQSSLGWFRPEDYGAVGDGTTNDAAAFTAMIAAIPSGGGVIYLSRKTYLINTAVVVDKPVKIVGDGGMDVTVLGAGGSYIISTASIDVFTFTHAAVEITSVRFKYTGVSDPTAGAGIVMNATALNATGFRIRDCSVEDFYDNIVISAGQNWVIDASWIASAERRNITVSNSINPDAGDGKISNSTIYHYDADVNAATGIYQTSSGGLMVVNTKFNGALQYGYYGTTGDSSSIAKFDNCSFENFTGSAIHAYGSRYVQVTDCEFAPYSTLTEPIINYISVIGGSISGNTFTNTSGNVANVAISTDAGCEDITVCGNSLTDFTASNSLLGTNIITCASETPSPFDGIQEYANDAAAGAAGLVFPDIYYTADGVVMIKLPSSAEAFSTTFSGTAGSAPVADAGVLISSTNFEVDGTGGGESIDGNTSYMLVEGALNIITRITIKSLPVSGDLSIIIAHRRNADDSERLTYTFARTSGSWFYSVYRKVGGVSTLVQDGSAPASVVADDVLYFETGATNSTLNIVGNTPIVVAHGASALTGTDVWFVNGALTTVYHSFVNENL